VAREKGRGIGHVDPDALRSLVADLVNEKLEQKLAGLDRTTAKAALKGEVLERIGSGVSSALGVWTRDEPGRRATLTRDELAATAVAIADAEGIRNLSMRRLASELGVGTMTLYHYVETKDELLALASDTVMGEVALGADESLPDGWRAALTVLAHRTRDACRRHPWVFDIADDTSIGPNSVRHFDQSLAAVSSLDIPLADRLEIVHLVDEYVFGHCLGDRHEGGGAGLDPDVADYIGRLVATGDYPQLAALTAERGIGEVWQELEDAQRSESRFDRGLERVLDGIAVSLERRVVRDAR
jgi:AcrR family transcriptional regulator